MKRLPQIISHLNMTMNFQRDIFEWKGFFIFFREKILVFQATKDERKGKTSIGFSD